MAFYESIHRTLLHSLHMQGAWPWAMGHRPIRNTWYLRELAWPWDPDLRPCCLCFCLAPQLWRATVKLCRRFVRLCEGLNNCQSEKRVNSSARPRSSVVPDHDRSAPPHRGYSMGPFPEHTLGPIHPSQQPTTTSLPQATSHITSRTHQMWPRMVAVPGGDAPPGTSTSQPATPLHSSSAPFTDGGTALHPLSI